ncbi:cyclopentanone monooxygenase [Colletotrichum truncatum]|uniref:Cyclopentanone monooxygenase n=1 Tax=Colletotrichum truncatum TaxID=5467 RepID=A0ACC3YC98_COLTU
MADYQIGSEHPQSLISDFVIVGTGFSGCYALHKIRELGYSAKILEAGSDFGGVWHFSLPKVWETFNFEERYPGHEEIRRYFAHVDITLGLRKDTIFNSRVDEVKYDSKSKRWLFRTEKGRRIESRFAIFACGSFNKPYIPAFPNLNAFRGLLIHPSAWPEGVKLDGKKIGIIGQGASGLQLVQELAKQDILLTVFIREPCHTLPMQQRRLSYRESEELKNYYDGIFSKAKFGSSSAIGYNQNSDFYHQASGSDRVTLYQRLWDRGGFGLTLSNYRDIMYDKTANSSLYEFWMRKTRARMSNPEKMDIVAPLKQSQWFGAKRVNLEMDYYEMLDRPNVKLVDLKKTPLKSFSRNGVVTEGHDSTLDHHELDVMILATGYDSVTGSLLGMNIHDRHGLRLEEKWKDGISTDLGMLVPEMPNAFLLYGPQGPITQTNAPSFIEL